MKGYVWKDERGWHYQLCKRGELPPAMFPTKYKTRWGARRALAREVKRLRRKQAYKENSLRQQEVYDFPDLVEWDSTEWREMD